MTLATRLDRLEEWRTPQRPPCETCRNGYVVIYDDEPQPATAGRCPACGWEPRMVVHVVHDGDTASRTPVP